MMFVTQCTQARRIQNERPAGLRRFKSNPTRSQHAHELPARKNQHIPLHSAQAVDHSLSSCVNLFWRLTARTSIAKQLPVRPLPSDLGTGTALILAIVPFDQVRVDFGHSSEAS